MRTPIRFQSRLLFRRSFKPVRQGTLRQRPRPARPWAVVAAERQMRSTPAIAAFAVSVSNA